jgi:hypothetical protein
MWNSRQVIKNSGAWNNIIRPIRDGLKEQSWLAAGRLGPPPHSIKYRNIMALADVYGATAFVETGSYFGDMIAKVLPRFDPIISIEVFPPLAQAAKRRFANAAHVEILEGDSTVLLNEAISAITGRIVFWLDGHYSGQGTGRADNDSPISHEMEIIFSARVSRGFRDLVLIDDARFFDGTNGYPNLKTLMSAVRDQWLYNVSCADDCIFVLPPIGPSEQK